MFKPSLPKKCPSTSELLPDCVLSLVLASPEKHRDQSSHLLISEQEEIPAAEVKEETTEEEIFEKNAENPPKLRL